MKNKFKKGDIILILANYTGIGVTLGYNLIPNLFEFTGPGGGLIDAYPWTSEALNGPHNGKNGALQAMIYTSSETASGTYTVTIQTRLGGTSKLTETKTVSFKVE